MLTYVLPVLIAYQGGKMVGGARGAVMGAIMTIGVICGTEYTMFMGAMIAGPLAGLVIYRITCDINLSFFSSYIKPLRP